MVTRHLSKSPIGTVGELRKLMQQHELTNGDVATLATVHPKTIESWLADPGAASFRTMAPRHLSLIRVMLPPFLAKRRAAQAREERKAAKA